MADNRKLTAGLLMMPESERQDLARMGEEYKRFQEADYLRKMGEQGIGLAKSVARGVPQMATGLVDLASLPFEAAGVIQPGQAVGSTKWLESKGYLPEAQPGFINQTVEGLASALDPSTMAAHALPAIGMLGKTVWHGSPHSFNAFDLSKVGTGEGAQVYGHGLYLAEHPEVAAGYQKRLSDASSPYSYEWRGQTYEKGSAKDPIAHAIGLTYHQNASTAKSIAKQGLKDAKAGEPYALDMGGEQYYQTMLDTVNQLRKKDIKATQGALYKVDLPDEHIAKMLDWHEPISEEMRKPISNAMMEKFGSGLSMGSGEQAYKQLVSEFKFAGSPNPAKDASEFLYQQDVPGIRYFDAGSRKAKEGTQNYVVFSDEIPQILERNNQPVAQALRKYEAPKQATLQDVVAPIEQRGVTLDVYESNKKPLMTLSRIEVPKEMRGQGVGSQAMQDLVNYANQQGKTIALSPSTDFGGTSVNRLKDFYKQFGFVENKGRNKDFAISESMYRLPETE